MRRTSAALLASALLSLTACGGEDTLSKEEFITQGDKICSDFESASEEVAAPTDEAGLAPYLDELVGLAQGARDDFAALTPPEDGESVQTALVDSLDTAIGTIEEASAAAEGGDLEKAGELAQQAAEEASAADDQVAEYGFQACASS